MQSIVESLWRIHTSTSEWVRFADAKASAILATEGVIAGVIFSNITALKELGEKHTLFYYLLLASFLAGGISFCYAIRCLIPRVNLGDLTSILYFGRIANCYENPSGYEEAVKNLLCDDQHIRSQLTQQIWANSKIAHAKFSLVNWSIRYFAMSILLGFFGAVTIFLT